MASPLTNAGFPKVPLEVFVRSLGSPLMGSAYRDRDEELDTGRIRPNFQAVTDQLKFSLVI